MNLKLELKYVQRFRDHDGAARYYFRRKGYSRIALKGEPGSPDFIAAYQSALTMEPEKAASPGTKGTFTALRDEYLKSAEFSALAKTTQREAKYVIDAFVTRKNSKGICYGDLPVAAFTRERFLRMRDGIRPGAANKMLGIIRAWLTFARDRNYRPDNPLLRIRKLKGGRYRAWTDQELTQFEECWPLGTRERTAYALALYWGQRKMDVKMLRWPMIQGDEIHLSDGQSKTGTPMVIAMHSELRKALDAIRPEGTPMGPVLTTMKASHGKKAGSQISAGHFGSLMADAIETAGLPKECVLHGLRVTHSRIVAETGGRVSATTGHMSANMERRYARDADQRKMARDNVLKWERRTKQESVKL